MAYSKHHETREGGTYLEDFLERLQPMPNDVQRSFHLMRELDKDAAELRGKMTDLEKRFLAQAKERIKGLPATATPEEKLQAVEDKELSAEISRLRALIMTKQREKLDVAGQVSEGLESHLKMLQADMDEFQTELRETGEYDFLGARKGDAVAFKQNVYETHFVLGTVASYRAETGTYEVVDVDEESRIVYALPETQVVLLPPASEAQKLKFQRGDEVFAVYPETTSFYLATIAQPPKRGSGAPGEPPKLAVQFQDDADENGFTPIRWVPVEYVFKAV